MRTTIRLDDDLFRRVKRLAAETGRTLTDVIEDALRQTLARSSGPRTRVSLPTFGGGRLAPGVDLDHNTAVRDVMDADVSEGDCAKLR